MKTMIKNNKKSLCIIAVVFLLILMNMSTNKTAEFALTANVNQEQECVEYSPELSLRKGDYKFTVETDSKEPIGLILSSSDNSNIYSVIVQPSERTFEVALEKSINGLKLTTDGTATQLKKLTVTSDSPLYTDTLFVALSVLFALLFMLWLKNDEKCESKASVAVIIAAAVVASYPLFTAYLNYGHDLNFHLWRIEGIVDGLRSGQFPVKIHPGHNNGYGYATATMYPELFLYFPALLRLLGVSLPTAYKALLIAANIATAVIMYYSTKKLTKSEFSSTIASVIYTLSTWRMINMYARAALGETLAMAFFPLVILGLYYVIKGDKSKWYVLAFAFTCLLQSHIISVVLAALLCLVIGLVFIRDIIKEKRWQSILKAVGLTFALNLWFLVPFMRFYGSLDLLVSNPIYKTDFYANTIIPAELFNVFNNSFGYSYYLAKGIWGNLTLTLGFTVSVCLVFAAWHFIFKGKNKLEHDKFTKIYFICGLMFIFAATSLFPWNILQKTSIINKFAELVQFPWRFLSIATAITTLAAAHIISGYELTEKIKKLTVFTVCVVSVFCMTYLGSAYSATSVWAVKCQMPTAGATGTHNEYLIRGTNTKELIPETYYTSDDVTVNSYEKRGTNLKFEIDNSGSTGYIEVPLLYYPGYKATDENGNKLDTLCGYNNMLGISLVGASGEINVKYSGLGSFRLAELISLITLLLFIFRKRFKKEWFVVEE